MSTNSNVDVEGEIDAGWSSYGVPSQKGETVAASSDDDKGDVETEFWPSHINPDDLTDKQRNAIRLALEDPTRSANEIDELIDSNQYANTILRDKLPEWYEDVFKAQGVRGRPRSEAVVEGSEQGDESNPDTSAGVDVEGLENVVEAMEATAQFEETKDALNVVKDYL